MIKHSIQKFIFVSLMLFCGMLYANDKIAFKITGVGGKLHSAILERLSDLNTNAKSEENNLVLINQAKESIKEVLQTYGYFKPDITFTTNEKTVSFHIEPGPTLHYSRILVTLTGPGKENSILQDYIQHFPLKSGQPLDIKKYEAAKEKLFLLANEQGYIKATLDKKELRINLKNNSADVFWEFNTEARYYFGPVIFEHNAYSPEFLQRFVPFNPHETFSSEKLIMLQQDLTNSRYFQQVEVTPDVTNPNQTEVPIQIKAIPPKSQRYDIGVGYGTATGPRLTLNADFRRVTPTGQHFSTELKLSSVLSGFTTKYFIPGQNPLTDQYTLGANVQRFTPKNGSSFSQTLSGSYTKNLKEWQNAISLNLLNERYKVEDKPTHQSQVLYPSWTVTQIKADDLIYPRFGNMFSLTLQGAKEGFLSRNSFFQGEIKEKIIFSPTKQSRLIFRGDLGYTVVDNLNQLPLTLRYFAGGLGSVRGYRYSSIGPGKYLQILSGEFQHKIYGKWNGAIFYDIGNASDQFNSNFKRGRGVGVIYRSLIGPIQFYVGQALSKSNKPYTFEFSMGPDF